MINKVILLVITYVIISCHSDIENKIENDDVLGKEKDFTTEPLKYATCFEILQQNNIQKVIIKNPFTHYKTEQVLVLIKNREKYTPKENETVLTVPIKSLIPFSSSYISMIDTLGEINTISAVESKNYIYNSKLLNNINAKKTKVIGNINQLNTETVLISAPDLLITIGTPGESAKQIQKLVTMGIPCVNNYDWQETHPLGKAEWIKFFGALYDRNEEANEIFNSIELNYNLIKTKKVEKLPEVLFSSLYNGVWYIPGGKSYGAQFLKDAGGTYPWINGSTQGSLPLSFETIANKQSTPDIWLSPNYTTLAEMTDDDSRYFSFLNAVNGKVYNQNKRTNSNGGNDYWERGALRPDLILKDYTELLKLDQCNEDSLFFFSKLPN